MSLALERTIEVCGETASVSDAIAIAAAEQPQVCIVGLDGRASRIAAVRGIVEAAPDTAVIVLADLPDTDDLLACVRSGAVGYLPSRIGRAALRRIVAAVAHGEAVIPRLLVAELLRELRASSRTGADGLTAREVQVLAMTRRGVSTAAIARELGISPITVRRHISAIVRKTGLLDRTALE
jgi:DNA-binding NarL/FixJ family response regulator